MDWKILWLEVPVLMESSGVLTLQQERATLEIAAFTCTETCVRSVDCKYFTLLTKNRGRLMRW